MRKSTTGFTIVELLIVIVVIAILATISIVAYNGIQGRAHNVAIQNDLSNLGKQLEIYRIDDPLPLSDQAQTVLSSLSFKPSEDSYSPGYITSNGGHNLLYCYASGTDQFALVAWSKSDAGFMYINGSVQPFEHAPAPQVNTCQNTGFSAGTRFWMYSAGSWRI